MKLLFILDPLNSLKTYKDTSIAIMREAAARGHTLYVCEQLDVMLQHEICHFKTVKFSFSDGENWYQLSEQQTVKADFFDAIFNRKDPPFDSEYLYLTHLLALASNQNGRVINNANAVRSWNEKLAIAKFPQFAPPFIVTSLYADIHHFLATHQDIIVKPLDGMGGAGIFRLTTSDPNLGAILETATQHQTQRIMVQLYLPQIAEGDKRILVINGEPVPYALARIPKAGETRGNLAAGGKGVAQPLSARDLDIATTVGKTLKAEGLLLVGLDVIGDYLTEINVTSPTGMVEIATQTAHLPKPCNPASMLLDALDNNPDT